MYQSLVPIALSLGLLSLASLVGLVLVLLYRQGWWLRASSFLLSFALGSFLGNALMHQIPAAVQMTSLAQALVLTALGWGLFWSLHRWLVNRDGAPHQTAYITWLWVGDGLHNFIDGAMIAVSYTVSLEAGMATTLAVLAHELPHELAEWTLMLRTGMRAVRAVWLNLLASLTAFAGAVWVLLLGSRVPDVAGYLLPIVAGNFLFLAFHRVLPELMPHRSYRPGLGIWVGFLCGLLVVPLLEWFHHSP